MNEHLLQQFVLALQEETEASLHEDLAFALWDFFDLLSEAAQKEIVEVMPRYIANPNFIDLCRWEGRKLPSLEMVEEA